MTAPGPSSPPEFAEAFRYWVRLGFINFGGPAGQIAILHRDLVERRRWISEERFLHALNFCMLLPGPEAQQLAIYIGWLLHGMRGGVVAGIFFVLPSVLVLLVLSWVYATHGTLPVVAGILSGLKPSVVAIVAAALVRIGGRALRSRRDATIAVLAFLAIAVLNVPFPWIVLGAGLAGWMLLPESGSPVSQGESKVGFRSRRMALRLLAISGIGLALWALPFLALVASRGAGSLHVHEYRFFTQAALVTFGGAYAVLAYVLQAASGAFGWITPADAIDGLALAETTPGPLIMVLQFVGFLAAWRRPEGMTPLASGVLGGLVTTWATFLPGFLFVLAGAPYIEALRGNRRLAAALRGVTAAVVGVIANLAFLFGKAVLFPGGFPEGADLFAILLAGAALAALIRLRLGAPGIVAAGAAAGLLRSLFS